MFVLDGSDDHEMLCIKEWYMFQFGTAPDMFSHEEEE